MGTEETAASARAAVEGALVPAPDGDWIDLLRADGVTGRGVPQRMSWREHEGLCLGQASAVAARGKDCVPTLCYFTGGRRREELRSVTGVFLDFDHSDAGERLRAAMGRFGVAHCLSESCSSAPGAERWHLVLPLAEPVEFPQDPAEHGQRWSQWHAEYTAVADALCEVAGLPRRDWDGQCKNPNRVRYLGTRLSESAAPKRVYHGGGRRLSWAKLVGGLDVRPVPRASHAVTARPDEDLSQASGPFQAGGQWPGDRLFGAEDYQEAFERCLNYLASPHLPPCIAKRGAHLQLMKVAVMTLRGWPLASRERVESIPPGERVPVDPADAIAEAVRLIAQRYNPRCLDVDAETQWLWSDGDIYHKVRSAAAADRLPGPDYWLFDAPDRRAEYADRSRRRSQSNVLSISTGQPLATKPPEPERAQARAAPPFAGLDESGEPADYADNAPLHVPICDPVEIEVSHRVSEMTERGCLALSQVPGVFTHQGKLCIRARNHDPELPSILYVAKKGTVTELLSRESVAVWYTDEVPKRGGEDAESFRVLHRPDQLAVKCLFERPVWAGVRPVKSVVGCPLVLPGEDGGLRILQRPGYDPQSMILYEPEPGLCLPPVSLRPSAGDCRAALDLLLGVVKDFPFEDPPLARGTWLSTIFTRLCKHISSDANTPLFAVSSSMPGSGKGKLCSASCIISDGQRASMIAYDPGDKSGELERKIGMEMAAGARSLCIDNVPLDTKLQGAILDMITTANGTAYTRKVGSSERIKLSFSDCLGWVTGNNLTLGGDLWRRVILMTIADRTGHPERRKSEQKDLEGYCRRNRADLLHAALTLCSGYIAAGCPQPEMAEMASFGGWDIVRRIVLWCGLPDPFQSRAQQDDDEHVLVRPALFAALRTAMGDGRWTPSMLAEVVAEDARRPRGKRGLQALHEVVEKFRVKPSADGLGTYLSHHKMVTTVMPNGERWTLEWRKYGGDRKYRVVVEPEHAHQSDIPQTAAKP